ncbi:MAG: LD-carboxypeptidase [Parasporobacterium sp.]|nr:LD-carboxypeptidase [Parasporobacterium sp.]
MIIPEYLKPGCRIGVTAPSHPIDREPDRERFEHGAQKLKERGYEVVFTPNVFAEADRFGRSASPKRKAEELHSLIGEEQIRGIYSAAGGDFLAEMLPYVDLELAKRHPKWIQGYSDNTSLLYYLTTKGDIATAYGANFGDFGMEPWDLSVLRGLQVLEGTCKVQNSFARYQDGFADRESAFDGYREDARVFWKCILGRKKAATGTDGEVRVRGRLLGGCMDVLLNLAGTRFDGTLEFIEKYREDRILWYLESFALNMEQMMEGLWKMKVLGWFEHASGIIFGRPLFYQTQDWDGNLLPTYEEVLKERLHSLQIPVITGADIGHKGPQFVMINGAMAEVACKNGKGTVLYL